MNFMYKSATLPSKRNSSMLADISQAATSLRDKLRELNIDTLSISDYQKRYLGTHVKNVTSTLFRYVYVLAWALADTNVPLDKFVFIDHGGGSGIMSLLAKELGISTVIYNDVYDVSCRDAETVATAIGNRAEHYVHGDMSALLEFISGNSFRPNALASYDVIEHIYDIDAFLRSLSILASSPFTAVLASGANARNPLKRRTFERLHRRTEHEDRPADPSHKERDTLLAYLSVRKQIISEHAPTLAEHDVATLAKATRGLVMNDIRKCVDVFIEAGRVAREPDHPTNTCDPYTGNWAERLMDTEYLRHILTSSGFTVHMLNGYYGGSNSAWKRVFSLILNVAISLLGHQGLLIAPFFAIHAQKEQE